MKQRRRFQAPGRLPVFLYLFRDLILFRRNGVGWRSAWLSALDYWRFDREAGN